MIVVRVDENGDKKAQGNKPSTVENSSSIVGFLPLARTREKALVYCTQGRILCSERVYELLQVESDPTPQSGPNNLPVDWKNKPAEDVLREIARACELAQTSTEKKRTKTLAATEISAEECEQVLNELEEIGWAKVVDVDEDFHFVEFQAYDLSNRAHTMRVNLRTKACSSDWSPLGFVSGQSLKDTVEKFEHQVTRFSKLWDELDRLDTSFRVLDPPLPASRAITRRRIAIFDKSGNQLSSTFLEIHLLPDLPSAAPCSAHVIGTDAAVQELREALERYQWNRNLNIRDNLCCAFDGLISLLQPVKAEATIPGADKVSAEEYAQECGVCYTYRLDDPETNKAELPDEGCANCSRPYHQSCIVGWLRSLPSARRSFNILVGECPYCGQDMTVKDVA